LADASDSASLFDEVDSASLPTVVAIANCSPLASYSPLAAFTLLELAISIATTSLVGPFTSRVPLISPPTGIAPSPTLVEVT
jgi:hypothetical protein